MNFISRLVYFWFGSLIFLLSLNLSAKSFDDPGLTNAIKQISSEASLLTGEDLDTSSCGQKKNPGIIEGDFKGDGEKDYAVLLKIGKVEDTVYKSDGNNYPWKRIKVWLVLFLGQADGLFKPVILKKIDDHSIPAYVFLKEINPGPLEESDSGKKIILKNIGIGLEFCEKSETVFYWDTLKNRFKEVAASD